jgi:diaminopimelate epimerase
MRIRFTKMHGLGNDFIVIDGISQRVKLTADHVRKLADRRFGIGCDQVLMVETPTNPDVDFRYKIFNHDGSEVENCGNGARCFAKFVRDRQLTGKSKIIVETCSGRMTLQVEKNGEVTVDMGVPVLTPAEIPFKFADRQLTYPLNLREGEIEISAVSMGNPHAVTVVDDVNQTPVENLGPEIESHQAFPNKVNAGFMSILSAEEINLRVYERGAGETLACGTGACAAVVTGRLRERLNENVKVNLSGGSLSIKWRGEGHPVMMTGPAETVFHGQVKI